MKLVRRYFALLVVIFFAVNLMACRDDVETLLSLLYLIALTACAIVVLLSLAILLSIISIIRAVIYHYRRWKEKNRLLRQKAEYTNALSALKWNTLRHTAPDDDRVMIEQHLAGIDARLAEFSKRKV